MIVESAFETSNHSVEAAPSSISLNEKANSDGSPGERMPRGSKSLEESDQERAMPLSFLVVVR